MFTLMLSFMNQPEQTVKMLVIRDNMTLMWCYYYDLGRLYTLIQVVNYDIWKLR